MQKYIFDKKELVFKKAKSFYPIINTLLLITVLLTTLYYIKQPKNINLTETKKIIVTEFDTTPLTPENVKNFIYDLDIKFPHIVYKQIMIETGSLKSNICRENNNIVGQRVEATNSDGSYRYPHYNIKKVKNRDHLVFANWKLSLIHYKHFQNYNFLNKDWVYYSFLQKLGYAESPNYIEALKNQK
jgi:hypothetical protein